jgi:hypothetical protein
MQDAHYYRNQAALCLAIANQLSDKRAAGKLRADAARFFSLAVELESKEAVEESLSSRDCPGCKRTMRLVGRENHSQSRKAEILTFECECGQLSTSTMN